jgi:hypothetical protein
MAFIRQDDFAGDDQLRGGGVVDAVSARVTSAR